MEVNELMFGNYIYIKDKYNNTFRIKKFEYLDTVGLHFSTIKPINLTESRILRFGFEKVNENSFRSGNCLVYLVPNGSGEFDFYFCGKLIATRFFVHQLQILYYAIENKKLECQPIIF